MSIPLSQLNFFLLDLDGTIYLGPNILPGAVDFIKTLDETGRKRLFFTNNSSADATYYSQKLQRMGIPADPRDILTSGEATARYIVHETLYRKVFPLGTPSFERELETVGLSLDDHSPDCIVLAFDRTLNYAKLEKACLFLRQGLPYIATNPDKVCPTEYGYIPDCASMAALLEVAAGRTPKYIGKPHAEMIQMGMDKIGATHEHTAMVGDRLYTDMEMAWRAGITSILVLSGESTPTDVEESLRKPDYIVEGVGRLSEMLRQ